MGMGPCPRNPANNNGGDNTMRLDWLTVIALAALVLVLLVIFGLVGS